MKKSKRRAAKRADRYVVGYVGGLYLFGKEGLTAPATLQEAREHIRALTLTHRRASIFELVPIETRTVAEWKAGAKGRRKQGVKECN